MTPQEAIAIIDTQTRYYYEQRIEHCPDDREGQREMRTEQKEFESLRKAISTVTHHLIPRTEPPTVEEAPEFTQILVRQENGHSSVLYSGNVRRHWKEWKIICWLPIPQVGV